MAKFTEDRAVASAATDVMQKVYEHLATFYWMSREYGIDASETGFWHGKYEGARDALDILLGKQITVPQFSLNMNGNTLVAINILNEGLYKSYIDGKVAYYTWKDGDKALSPERDTVVERAWIWLDPYAR